MKVLIFFFLTILYSSISSAHSDCKALKGVELDGFVFQLSKAGDLRARMLDKNLAESQIEIKRSRGIRKSKSIKAELIVKDKFGSVCKQLTLKVDPIKLCKNASDGSFDPWRFVICKQGASNPCPPGARAGAISIVGSRTNIWNSLGSVKLEDASICGTTQLTGQVTVIRSILTEKSF